MDGPTPEQPIEGPGHLLSSYPKQAIVVLHGIGEQRPMDTIKSVARAVWAGDSSVWNDRQRHDPGAIWSKPDTRTGSLELRRLTTRESKPNDANPNGVRQDFYELYWADQSGGSTWEQVKSWVLVLLLRNPFTNVPRGVRSAWIVLWLATLLVGLLVVAAALPAPKADAVWPDRYAPAIWNCLLFRWLVGWPTWLLALIVGGLGLLARLFVVPYVGRVVRYTRANPENIAARAAIRERGLALLKALHDQEYDRIIFVAHSLGAILAYDLLAYHWANNPAMHTLEPNTAEFTALCELERVAGRLKDETDAAKREALVEKWHVAQRHFGRLLRTRPKPGKSGAPDTRWLITDLVTVGSPLGHADFLIAKNRKDREARIEERELAVCPPLREAVDDEDERAAAKAAGLPVDGPSPSLFCFRPNKSKNYWQLHHAAQFAAVRWTNIHDPAVAVLLGDIISRPARPIFGPGVVDIDLRTERGQSLWFTHTRYWQDGDPTPIPLVRLRKALDLAAATGA